MRSKAGLIARSCCERLAFAVVLDRQMTGRRGRLRFAWRAGVHAAAIGARAAWTCAERAVAPAAGADGSALRSG